MSARNPDELTLAERRHRVVDLVCGHGFIQVRRLAEMLRVSEVTIRQDLRELDETGALRRVRGGARVISSSRDHQEPQRTSGSAAGIMAAAFVRGGDTIVLDGHYGTVAVADALVARGDLSDVTVRTETLRVLPSFLGHEDRFAVFVPAGTLAPSLRIDPDRDECDPSDLAVICCAGVNLSGLLASTELEAAAYRRAARTSDRMVAVVAPGGFDASRGFEVCPLEQIDACITEERVPEAIACPLRTAGLRLFTAS